MRNLRTLLVALAAALGPIASHGAAITNGSFETASLSGWGGTATTDGHGYNPLGTLYGSGMDGTHWMWLGGYEIGRTLNQSITGLTSGNSYRVSFIMASEYTRFDQLNVSIDGGAKTLFTADPTITIWNNWQKKTYDFVAAGTSSMLEFSSVGLNQGGYDVGLDNVRIEDLGASVPEPASLALVAISLFGLAASRRPKFKS